MSAGVDAERLAHFARGAAAAIGDDVGGHRRAARAVALVDVLDHLLAPIAARQIEIDVRPLAALLREEALEEQLHADRIDGGDAEAVADRAVGGRAAALHEDVVLAAEVDEVPDDQEVAGQIELLDQIELARDLGPGAIVVRPVALARADVGDLAQERRLRLPRRHRIVGEAVAEIGHRVVEPIGQLARRRDRVRQIGEELRHLRRRLQVALGVARQALPGAMDVGLVADAGEDVEQRPILRRGEADAVGREQRHVIRRGQRDERLVVGLLVALQVPLQLDVEAIAAEHADQAIEQPADAVPRVRRRARRGRPARQAAGRAVEILEAERAAGRRDLALRRARLHPRDQAAQVAIAVARRDQHRQPPQARRMRAVRLLLRADGQLGADERLEPGLARRHVQARRAVDAVPIEHREGRIAERRGPLDQRLGRGGGFQEREGRCGMQLDVHASSFALFSP